MTRYSAGSSILVPPSLTISAVIPCAAPNSLTRSMKAGGKLYSRPHMSPTLSGRFRSRPSLTIAAPLVICDVLRATCSVLPVRVLRATCFRPLDAGLGFLDHELYDSPEIARFPKDGELTVGAGAFPQHRMDVAGRLATVQVVDDIIDELEQLQRQVAHRHFGPFAEV